MRFTDLLLEAFDSIVLKSSRRSGFFNVADQLPIMINKLTLTINQNCPLYSINVLIV